ncbi:MAG: hypothetical protein IJG13_06295 [Kiritimatiellae bacterium]|nr:hypothetical protein [Kiritimatiellia bacterium]
MMPNACNRRAATRKNSIRLVLVVAATVIGTPAFAEWSWTGKTGDVTLPAEEVTVTDGDCAVVSALTGIAIPEGCTLKFANTCELVLSARLSGAGAISALNCGKITLTGDNRGHSGAMGFEGTPVTVAGRYALGSPTRTVTHKQNRIVFSGAGLTNDVPLETWGNRTDNALTADIKDPLLMNGAYTHHGGYFKFGNWTFTGGFTFGSETMWSVSIGLDCHTVITNKPFASYSYYLPFSFYAGSFDVSRSATVTLAATNNVLQRLGLDGCYGSAVRGFVCGAANVIDPLRTFGLGRANSNHGTLNLNGFDQKVLQVCYPTNDGWEYQPVRGDNGTCSIIMSDRPATLTMTASNDKRVDYLVKGAVSIVRTGSATYTFLNRYCDTTGTVTMDGDGAIAFDWEAGWGGDVHVKRGQIRFLEGSSLNRDSKSRITIDGGKLYVTNGVTLNCSSLQFGEAQMPIGTYAASDSAYSEWLDGEGSIVVSASYPDVPTRLIWKGASGGSMTDPANWEGNIAPAFTGGETLVFVAESTPQALSFPSGISVVHGIEFRGSAPILLSGNGELRVGPSGILSASSAVGTIVTNVMNCAFQCDFFDATAESSWTVGDGSALEVRGNVSGGQTSNTIRLLGAGTKILSGKNEMLLAALSYDDGNLVSRARMALGSPLRHTIFNCPAASGTVTFAGSCPTNATPIRLDKSRKPAFAYDFPAWDGAFVFEGEVKIDNGLWSPAVPRGLVFRGGIAGSGSFWFGGSGTQEIRLEDNPIRVWPSEYLMLGSSTWHFHATGNIFNRINIASRLVCEATNVITAVGDNGHVVLGGPRSVGGGTLDLNGYDQDILACRGYETEVTEDCRQVGIVASESPAVLRLCSPIPTNTRQNDYLPWRFTGLASFEHASVQTNVFINELSPSAGYLKVTAGRLELRKGAGWTNVNEVAISGGTLYVRSDSMTCAFGNRLGRSHAAMTIGTGGILDLGAGQATVLSLAVGGVDMPIGYYGSPTCADSRVLPNHRLSCISGDGVLRVRGIPGLHMIIR